MSDSAGLEAAEWVTVVEAARRLAMSPSWFRALAKEEGIEVVRRGGQPGLNGAGVQRFVARSRISRVTSALLRQVEPETPIRGVTLVDRVKGRFDWFDGDIAEALGVWPGTVSRYRLNGVPSARFNGSASHVRCVLIGSYAPPTPEKVAAERSQNGLDEPTWLTEGFRPRRKRGMTRTSGGAGGRAHAARAANGSDPLHRLR